MSSGVWNAYRNWACSLFFQNQALCDNEMYVLLFMLEYVSIMHQVLDLKFLRFIFYSRSLLFVKENKK